MNSNTDELPRGVINKPTKKVKKVRSRRILFFSRFKRRLFTHVWFLRLTLLAGIASFFLALALVLVLLLNTLGLGRYVHLLATFVFTPRDKIESIGGRTNILILGKGGAGHEAPELTDTMIFATIGHSGQGLSLISIPRDIWIDELRAKLNSAYYWGNQKTEGGGEILAKASVEEIVGQPMQYVLVIDLSSLGRVVDALGGVEIEVENSFSDEKFPIQGREADLCGGDPEFKCRYETVTFEKGKQIMDGTLALKFIRSRNAKGDEGTDLARARRQQKVIDAIERKVLSREVYLSWGKLRGLLDIFDESVETDMNQDALAIIARRLFDSRGNRKSYVLGEEFLENPPISPKYDNLYVFIPKSGSWDDVHKWIEGILNGQLKDYPVEFVNPKYSP